MIEVIVGLLIAAAVIGFVVWLISSSNPTDRTIIQAGPTSGKTQKISSLSINRSFNQPDGMVFSYAGWLLVNDFTVNYGKKRLIFKKGDCPALYLDTTSNALLVEVQTFGSVESILIPNIPAKKWMHIALVVNQYSVDIYINGTLRQHHTLSQLPKQNDEPLTMGSNETGWDGVLSDLTYFMRSLNASEIEEMAKAIPKDDLYKAPAGPQYFDRSWYIGRI